MTRHSSCPSSHVTLCRPFFSLLFASALVLILGSAAQAAISGINSPITSTGSVNWDDTNSFDPILTPGVTNTGPSTSPWNGSLLSLPTTTDPVTFDFANGDMSASFAGNSYALNLTNVTNAQMVGNTGFADLMFTFDVEYQLDALGLPTQPTLYPNFAVTGTVQPGGFALVSGFINYDGVNTAGTISTLDTVNYNSLWNTPGPFGGTAFGNPTFGNTPILVANTTLRMYGQIHFMVDPATINANSFQVPEPSTLFLGCLGTAGLLFAARRRRARAASASCRARLSRNSSNSA